MARILVTGGAGYIGSHAVRQLLQHGYDPIVVDDLSGGYSWAIPSCRLVRCRISDTDRVRTLIAEQRIVGVLHFAGLIISNESVKEPYRYYRANVCDTLELLRTVVESGVRHFVFSSSAAVYGNPAPGTLLSEEAALAPINTYGRTKMVVERILSDFARAYGLTYVCARYFNVAGAHPSGDIGEAHDPETHLIPLAIEAALGLRKSFTIYGTDFPTRDGTCIRDYIHITDLVEAHVLALEYLLDGGKSQTFNCGYGRGYTVREVVDAVKRSTGQHFPVTESERRVGDPAELVAQSEHLRTTLGWHPQCDDLQMIIDSARRWMESDTFRSHKRRRSV
jgi:UDP-glucose 4-epimerase